MTFQNKNGGFIKWILILIVALVILSHYNISIREIFTSPVGQDNVGYIWDTSRTVWENYLKGPVSDLFNLVWTQLILPLVLKQ